MKIFKLFLFTLPMYWPISVYSASQCSTLFISQNEILKDVVTQFRKLFQGKSDRMSLRESQAADRLIHITALRFSTEPELKPLVKDFVAALEKIDEERPPSGGWARDSYGQKLDTMVQLLELGQGHLESWKTYISNANTGLNNWYTSETSGYLLQSLPEKTKAQLLQWMGAEYSGDLKRQVTSPIHTILDPRRLYEQFKSKGRSDREFYNEYLSQIKKQVFGKNPKIGGYTGDLVIQIARAIQIYLRSKTDMQAINFFGSVANGFGTPKSDLDIFNHPVEKFYPDLTQMAKESAGDPRIEDPFTLMRYQIDDPELAFLIGKITKSTQWRWHLENTGEHAHEHFASQGHVFSFHITKEKINLRFYYNYLHLSPDGKQLKAWDYINLNIDD